ncbi:MAG: hypothetical protein K2X98_04795 [Alphaproteobacteria bacterium]|nr:hypothetical protein [Alphaproteobacteria bacterium]
MLWVNFDGEDKISTIETYKRQNDPHPLVNGEGSVGIVYVSPTADPVKAQSFLLNKYKDYISYYFSFFDNGNFHLLGYIHPNAQVIVPSSDTGGKSSFGKLLVLSSAPLSQDAQYKIENLENYLDTCRGYLYPIDLLIQEDEKTNIHDLSDEFFRQLVSNQNLVGAAPLILEGTIPPGYNNTYFDQMGVMDLNKIGTGEAFTKLSDANFETLFPIVKILKDEVLRAKEALRKDQSNGQLNWNVTQAEKELKEFRESTALKDDIQSVLGKNTNVPYIPLIVKEEKKYIPNSPTRDWEWDMKFDLGQEKTAKISYLTSAAALRNFVDTRSDGDFFANNEYYMIEKSDLMYKNYGDSFGQKFNDLPDVLYSHFYVDKILFRYDKRTKTLHKESDGLMALSESGIQLPMLVGCIEKKYGLGEGTVKVAALDPSLGYKKSTIAIDTSAMEYKNYVAPKTLSQHSSQQGAKIQGIGAKAFKKAQKLVKPGDVKKIDKS